MAKYCSLAMEFTPSSDSETLTALLSNRCVAFISLKQWETALADAEKCTTIRPQWFKVSCLLQYTSFQFFFTDTFRSTATSRQFIRYSFSQIIL